MKFSEIPTAAVMVVLTAIFLSFAFATGIGIASLVLRNNKLVYIEYHGNDSSELYFSNVYKKTKPTVDGKLISIACVYFSMCIILCICCFASVLYYTCYIYTTPQCS